MLVALSPFIFGTSQISNCFKLHVPSRNLRSYKDCLRLDYPRTRVQAGSFTVCDSKLWNNIPVRIRQPVSVTPLKRHLRHTCFLINLFSFIYYIFAHFLTFFIYCKRLEPLGMAHLKFLLCVCVCIYVRMYNLEFELITKPLLSCLSTCACHPFPF